MFGGRRRAAGRGPVVSCSEEDRPEHRVGAPGSPTRRLPGPTAPGRQQQESAASKLLPLYRAMHYAGTSLPRSPSLSLALPLCPLLCGKNRSTDPSVQLLTFTWISPTAAAVDSRFAHTHTLSRAGAQAHVRKHMCTSTRVGLSYNF